MQNILLLWLNPLDLGIFFLCLCAGVWVLAHSAPASKDR